MIFLFCFLVSFQEFFHPQKFQMVNSLVLVPVTDPHSLSCVNLHMSCEKLPVKWIVFTVIVIFTGKIVFSNEFYPFLHFFLKKWSY